MTTKTGRPSFSSSSPALLSIPYSITPGESRNFDLTTSSQNISSSTINDPAYLTIQLRSSEWIERYGLKPQKLTFDQILQQIGFKRVESFDPVIGKTVTAKYAGNLYHEIQHDNGDRYVLTCRPEKLREYHYRLVGLLNLLRKRLHFISSGSRRLFGVISEPSVCLVCDCKTIDHRIFNQYQIALTSLLKEQITKIKRFNIVWVSNDNEQFHDAPIDVVSSNIDQAIDWIYDRKCPRTAVSVSATCEAVMKAFKNDVHGIYLISEGDSSDSAREMLRDSIVKSQTSSNTPIPLHVVSLYCHNNDTQSFLRSLAEAANGSYFCYKIRGEVADLKAPSNLNDPTRIQIQGDKLQFGSNALTPIPEYPQDITLMYKEIIKCQTVIDRLEKILGFIRDENQSSLQSLETKSLDAFNVSGEHNFQRSVIVQSSTLFNHEENEMTSTNWLKLYGIDAQKLDFFSVLHAAAFRHCDGVVKVLKPPEDTEQTTESTPANPEEKLINAKYCDQFAHVAWPDGTIRHVHVTPELYRDYERRLKAVLEKTKARLTWLKKGSRDVFGTILENNIYILIDTSKSMQHHLAFVKEKLRLLIQDQLATKDRVNFVAFNTAVTPWRDRLTKINESTAQSQLQPWIDGLHAEGTTNTLAALRFAMADSATEAIYLLTDGRPDQSERHILSQVQYRQMLPIHTIAFNCHDQTANQFLYDLAKQTGGRFHAFNYGFEKPTTVEIPESEDVGYLKQEFQRGQKELEKIAALRDECLGLAWSKDNAALKTSKYISREKSLNSLLPELKIQNLAETTNRPSSSATVANRVQRKKKPSTRTKRRRRSCSATNSKDRENILKIGPETWLLPETKAYLKSGQPECEETSEEPKREVEEEEEEETIPTEKTSYDKVKVFMKKNSLVKRGLTIFDVIQPTSVLVKEPQYLQVIDKYVLAKVWDDILPMAYGSYAGKLRLVNHYAVDLEHYESELSKLINEYHQFVSKYIWRRISDEDKQKLGPHLYWIGLSKDEIEKFKKTIDKDNYKNQDDLELFAWRELTSEQQQTFLQTPPKYQDNIRTLLRKTLKEANDESTLKGVSRIDVEIKRGVKFLQISADLRQLQKRQEPTPKPAAPPVKLSARRKPSIDRNYGQRVICRCDDDGFFRPGVVQRSVDNRTIVRFDMNFEQEVVGHVLLPIGGAIAQPTLYVNDPVLVRQSSGHDEYWVPGLIALLPLPGAPPPPLYTVEIFTPTENLTNVYRKDLMKISLPLFQRTVLYLKSINHRLPPKIQREENPSSSDRISNTLRRELQPLTDKVDGLYRSHNQRYDELKSALEGQMKAIRNLQDKTLKPILRHESTQAAAISLLPATSRKDSIVTIERPDPPRIPSARSESTRSSSSKSQTARSTLATPDEPNPQMNEVVAVWFEDDGFGHPSFVLERFNETKISVVSRVDLPGYRWEISHDDIFLLSQRKKLREIPERSFALIEVVRSSQRQWIPAAIVNHDRSKDTTTVTFYNCVIESLPNDDIILPITAEQFQRYASNRMEIEKKLVGKTIVGFNHQEKVFMLGTVVERIGNGHEYRIEWCDGTVGQENDEHLFAPRTADVQFNVNQYVLTIDNEEKIYRLAQIISISKDPPMLTVRLDRPDRSQRKVNVSVNQTFLITDEYYRAMSELVQA